MTQILRAHCAAQTNAKPSPKASEPVVALLSAAEKDATAELDVSFSHIRGYDFKAAKASLTKARQTLPRNPVLLNNLGLIFAIDKDFANASRMLAEARSNATN